MYDIIFYILFVFTLTAGFYISFGKSTQAALFGLFSLLISLSGILALLNSELFALINILGLTGISVLFIILFPDIRNVSFAEESPLPKSHFLSISIIGVLTALLSSLVSSTRWPQIDINYEFNSFLLIFIKYLPVIILLAVTASVLISSLSVLLNKNKVSQ